MRVRVTNTSETPVERAGRVFDRRSSQVLDLSGPKLAEVRATRVLQVVALWDEEPEDDRVQEESQPQGEAQTPSEAEEEQGSKDIGDAVDDDSLENKNKTELVDMARERQIPGYSMLTKAQLIEALRKDAEG